MSNGTNPFDINPEGSQEEIPSATSQPQNQPASVSPQQGEANVQRIGINRITGPLVVFFGPREIGKTVTLLRLCTYIRDYEIRPDPNFRTDADYPATIDAFERIRQNMQFAPDSTGDINFLLLNVTYEGNRFCQILESPGEHFFDRKIPNKSYPDYMSRMLAENYRKIFVFFFELNMFNSDTDLENYANQIARLVNEKISPKRDRIIIVCNKCDLHQYFRGGKPIKAEYKNAIYDHPSFKKLKDILKKGGFGHISFVPFSSGTFNDDGTGRLAFALSPEHYPQELWREIHDNIQGSKSIWQLLKFW